ncbi:hypothetical protein NIES4071_29380 [Calothrix sp. NIES-4071]|nr:hypothetical protein NIES4071_29380 [Calothrix sp. NIES-4071]BAZ57258.1 hypothetical protein NIES4105_29320 [Calothrix sp. NIES-4105]
MCVIALNASAPVIAFAKAKGKGGNQKSNYNSLVERLSLDVQLLLTYFKPESQQVVANGTSS